MYCSIKKKTITVTAERAMPDNFVKTKEQQHNLPHRQIKKYFLLQLELSN